MNKKTKIALEVIEKYPKVLWILEYLLTMHIEKHIAGKVYQLKRYILSLIIVSVFLCYDIILFYVLS